MHASSKQSLIILSPHRLTTSLSLSHTHPSSPSHSSLSHTHPLTFSLPHTHLIPRPLTFSLPPSHPSPSPSHSLPPHLTPSLTLISSLPHTHLTPSLTPTPPHPLSVPDVISSVTNTRTFLSFLSPCRVISQESYSRRMFGCCKFLRMATSSLNRACSVLL